MAPGRRRVGEGGHGGLRQLVDLRLHAVDGAGLDEHGLQTGDLVVVEVGGAVSAQHRLGPPARSPQGGGIEHGGLPLAEVLPDRLPRHRRVAEHPEQVVPQLEGLAQRKPEGRQWLSEVGQPPGQGGAQVEGALHGVLARLVARDAPGLLLADPSPHGADEVEVLAHVDLDAQLVEDLECVRWGGGQQPVGVHEGQVAHQDRHALAEPASFAPPAVEGVALLEGDVDGVGPPPEGGAVHDVVVDQGEGVQHLQGGPTVGDEGIAGVASGAGERPVAERRAQALAAGQDQLPEGDEGFGEIRTANRPALQFPIEEVPDPVVDAACDPSQAGRRRGCCGEDSH